jgi:hypothetical protein
MPLYLQDGNNVGICIDGVQQIFVFLCVCVFLFPILIFKDMSKYKNLLLLSLQVA